MGALANKQKVTLTLNKDIYKRTRELVDNLPGKPSVSSLVDDLLDQFVTTMQPAFREVLFSKEAAVQAEALKRVHGELVTLMGLELAGTIRVVEVNSKKEESGT
jgi:hypothetical protein